MAKGLREGVVCEAQAFGNYHEESSSTSLERSDFPAVRTGEEPNLPGVLRKELLRANVAIVRWPESWANPSSKH